LRNKQLVTDQQTFKHANKEQSRQTDLCLYYDYFSTLQAIIGCWWKKKMQAKTMHMAEVKENGKINVVDRISVDVVDHK